MSAPPPAVTPKTEAIPPPPAYPHPEDVAARGEFKGRKVVDKTVDKEKVSQKAAGFKIYYMDCVGPFTGPTGNKIIGAGIKSIPEEMMKDSEKMNHLIAQKRLVKVDFDDNRRPVKFNFTKEMITIIVAQKAEEMFLNSRLIPNTRIAPLLPESWKLVCDPAIYKNKL